MDFFDLQGASGRVYRFRRWPGAGRHPAIAGNYLLVDLVRRECVALGLLDDLSRAEQRLGPPRGEIALFTRLNISRAHREAEHADLAAAHPRADGAARFDAA